MKARLFIFFVCAGLSRLAGAPLDAGQTFVYLLQFEGYKLTPYKDRSSMSVGLGHNLTARGQPVRPYTDEECRAFFAADFADALRICRACVTDFDSLPLKAQEACISIEWTVGPTGFTRWKDLRFALSHRQWEVAAVEVGLSKWYKTQPAERVNAVIRAFQSL